MELGESVVVHQGPIEQGEARAVPEAHHEQDGVEPPHPLLWHQEPSDPLPDTSRALASGLYGPPCLLEEGEHQKETQHLSSQTDVEYRCVAGGHRYPAPDGGRESADKHGDRHQDAVGGGPAFIPNGLGDESAPSGVPLHEQGGETDEEREDQEEDEFAGDQEGDDGQGPAPVG